MHLQGKIPDFTSHSLPIIHSSSLSYFEYNSSSNSCVSYIDFEGKCNDPTMTNLVESVNGKDNGVSKEVFAFNSSSIPSYVFS